MWRSVKTDPPPRDGSYVMFGVAPERWDDASCPCEFGFWHVGQNIPGWANSYGMTIIEDYWPLWQPLPNRPAKQ